MATANAAPSENVVEEEKQKRCHRLNVNDHLHFLLSLPIAPVVTETILEFANEFVRATNDLHTTLRKIQFLDRDKANFYLNLGLQDLRMIHSLNEKCDNDYAVYRCLCQVAGTEAEWMEYLLDLEFEGDKERLLLGDLQEALEEFARATTKVDALLKQLKATPGREEDYKQYVSKYRQLQKDIHPSFRPKQDQN